MSDLSSALAPDVFLRPAEVAARTGYAVATLATLRHRGEGPAFRKVNRAVMYRWGDVLQWLGEARSTTSDAFEAVVKKNSPMPCDDDFDAAVTENLSNVVALAKEARAEFVAKSSSPEVQRGTCAGCAWFVPLRGLLNRCHRHAPVSARSHDKQWPRVRPDDFCGDWTAA